MTEHTQYGTLVDSGIPHQSGTGGTEAFIETPGCVSLMNKGVMPTSVNAAGEDMSVLAMTISGDVVGKEETLGVIYILSWQDAGHLVSMIMDAAKRSPDDGTAIEFLQGLKSPV